MFRAAELSRGDDLIPLNVLQLDLDQPAEGWTAFLCARDIVTELDDLGRLSVSQSAARQLFVERRELEARAAAKRAVAEREAIERDRQYRARLYKGVSADMVPIGVHPATAMLQARQGCAAAQTVPVAARAGQLGSDDLSRAAAG